VAKQTTIHYSLENATTAAFQYVEMLLYLDVRNGTGKHTFSKKSNSAVMIKLHYSMLTAPMAVK
jgi:hypothetical protein